MRPRDPSRESLDPAAFLREHGESALAELFRERSGYVFQRRPLMAFCESIESGKPLLCEGPRGCGKSALAEAAAEVFNLDYYYLQCMVGITKEEILYDWDHESQRTAGREDRFTREHLLLGEVLEAFEQADRSDVPPIIHLDEIDKLDKRAQSTLLQVFQNGFADIPRLKPTSRVGLSSPAKRRPFGFATSNAPDKDLGEEVVESPLRSRFLYTWFEPPSAEEEIQILRARVTGAPVSLLLSGVRALDAIRHMPEVLDPPGLRETITLLTELSRKGAVVVTEALLERHMCHIAKRALDQANLLNASARLARDAARPDMRVDSLVAKALGYTPDALREVAYECYRESLQRV